MPETYKPVFTVAEEFMPDVGDKEIGQRLQAILNFEVVEKTKNFTILKIRSTYLLPVKRKF